MMNNVMRECFFCERELADDYEKDVCLQCIIEGCEEDINRLIKEITEVINEIDKGESL